ncbi:hypothetical protein KR067_011974 [Drosophila pandora]|nr:hypothetical protein KR067_011974 [Drosophila pandora]
MSLPSVRDRRALRHSMTHNPRANPRAVHFVGPSVSPKRADSSHKCLEALVSDPVESLGAPGSPGDCNILYKNSLTVSGTDKGYEPGVDSSDDWEDTDKLQIKYRSARPDKDQLEDHSRSDLQAETRFGGLLRSLARSLHQCYLRIAAGFGLSHQHSAWYKHCWHSPSTTRCRVSLDPMDFLPRELHETRDRTVSSCTEL